MKILLTTALLSTALAAQASAPIPIIDEQSPTVPAAPYLQAISPDIGQLVAGITPETIQQAAQAPAELHIQVFPVTTPSMTPGKVTAKNIQLPLLPGPVFVIGDDKKSRHWLLDHKQQLEKLKATGIVASVQTETALKHLQKLAKPLLLLPVSAEQIGQSIEVTHYPILVTATQVSQ